MSLSFLPLPLLYLAIGFLLSVVLVRIMIPILRRIGVMDVTRVQSMQHPPIPRGGGWGVTPVVAILWLSIAFFYPDNSYKASMLAALALFIPITLISWMDDKREQGLSVWVRLLLQSLAVIVPILLLPSDVTVCLGYLPVWLDRLVTILGFWWFVNLFNFMDGINGITGLETSTIGLGVFLCAFFNEQDLPLSLMGMVLLGCAAGYLVWNWRYNALVFLGDVGSVGLGYFCGFALIILATKGHFWPAALMSLYYSMDATTTLIKRLYQGDKVWEPARKHFYHAGTIPGALNSIQATMRLLALNIVLLIMAFCASRFESGWAYMPIAMVLCAFLMWHYKQHEKRALAKGTSE